MGQIQQDNPSNKGTSDYSENYVTELVKTVQEKNQLVEEHRDNVLELVRNQEGIHPEVDKAAITGAVPLQHENLSDEGLSEDLADMAANINNWANWTNFAAFATLVGAGMIGVWFMWGRHRNTSESRENRNTSIADSAPTSGPSIRAWWRWRFSTFLAQHRNTLRSPSQWGSVLFNWFIGRYFK